MLSEEQIQFYKDNGYVKLDNILTPEEVDDISTEYDEIFNRNENEDLETLWKVGVVAPKKTTVKSIHNLQHHSAVFSRLLTNEKLLDAVQGIMGTPNILLHHTKAHVKPPEEGSPFPMHQDYGFFPHKKDSLIAVFLHLDDTTPENGGLAVYPGSHKLGPLEDKSPDPEFHFVDQEKFSIEKATPVYAKKGEIVIFSYLTIHGSYLNLSKDTRRMLLIQLMSAEDEPIEDVHLSPGQGLVLRGKNVQTDANFNRRYKV